MSGSRLPSRLTADRPKHHALARLSHLVNVPLLLGLIASGLSIYWAWPVFVHAPDRATRSTDYLADAGIWLVRHVPGLRGTANPYYVSIDLATARHPRTLLATHFPGKPFPSSMARLCAFWRR